MNRPKPYIPGDIVEAIQAARSLWTPWPEIASRLGLTVEQCREAVGMPATQQEADREAGPDLFAGVDRLDAVL
jgi:hypothetical protein